MPELPEVETVRLALDKIVKNALVKKVEIYRYDLRWKVKDNLKVNLEKDILKKPFRMGKYILIPTIKNKILLIHLVSFCTLASTSRTSSLMCSTPKPLRKFSCERDVLRGLSSMETSVLASTSKCSPMCENTVANASSDR